MKTIVVVFMPVQDGQQLAEQADARPLVDLLRQATDSDNATAGFHETCHSDRMTPLFWTWFIENPRSRA